MAAISGLATNVKFLKRVFFTESYSKQGIYGLRLCKFGNWVTTVIDDLVPMKDSLTFLFCEVNTFY